MDVVFLIGRVLFGLLFVFSGFMAHLGAGGREGREYARSLGAPAPDILVPLSGVSIIAGGLMVALGLWADLGALVLIATLAPITYYMHPFWKFEGMDRVTQQAMFFKNFAMIGGFIVIFWLYNQGQDVAASLTDALFGWI